MEQSGERSSNARQLGWGVFGAEQSRVHRGAEAQGASAELTVGTSEHLLGGTRLDKEHRGS